MNEWSGCVCKWGERIEITENHVQASWYASRFLPPSLPPSVLSSIRTGWDALDMGA